MGVLDSFTTGMKSLAESSASVRQSVSQIKGAPATPAHVQPVATVQPAQDKALMFVGIGLGVIALAVLVYKLSR